jgi:hypothetical protein
MQKIVPYICINPFQFTCKKICSKISRKFLKNDFDYMSYSKDKLEVTLLKNTG